MKYEYAKKVYVCCGQYVIYNGKSDKKLTCPRCGRELNTIRLPKILIAK